MEARRISVSFCSFAPSPLVSMDEIKREKEGKRERKRRTAARKSTKGRDMTRANFKNFFEFEKEKT